MKTLEQLINHDDPGMPVIQALLAEATQPCRLLPRSADGERVLLGLQVSTRSPLGTLALESGGLLIEHGWLRVLGGGHPLLPRNLLDWNQGRGQGFLLVADDAVGGFFAINGGGLGEDIGKLYYWAPDTLAWEGLGLGYSDFLGWALSEGIVQFYASLRWPGWEHDVQGLTTEQCFSFYPFLWSQEGSVLSSSRKAVAVAEQFALMGELAGQLGA